MSTESGDWLTLLQWAVQNPEKGALALVLLAGAWRWVRELRKDWKDDTHQETFTEVLMKENKELRAENKELVHELREARSQRNQNHQANLDPDRKR